MRCHLKLLRLLNLDLKACFVPVEKVLLIDSADDGTSSIWVEGLPDPVCVLQTADAVADMVEEELKK